MHETFVTTAGCRNLRGCHRGGGLLQNHPEQGYAEVGDSPQPQMFLPEAEIRIFRHFLRLHYNSFLLSAFLFQDAPSCAAQALVEDCSWSRVLVLTPTHAHTRTAPLLPSGCWIPGHLEYREGQNWELWESPEGGVSMPEQVGGLRLLSLSLSGETIFPCGCPVARVPIA